ncbi:MAG: FliA/WhiG family RNA polymerase sigma factor [Clostridiales bacterium]|nr:FliA/WhiG family RNA polymerase sigma factor [Clostridiales bacterium]MCF8021702.1 FliA/WhiG family RNA polymerase sigma factor [Clostridiales bacterium]
MIKSELWEKYRCTRDEKLKQELVLEYLDIVKYAAGKLSVKLPAGMSTEDLGSCGILGLLEAVDRFDPTFGVEFEAFARRRIYGAMYDEIRKSNWIPRTTWQKMNRVYNTKETMEKSLGRSVTNQELAKEAGITLSELSKLNNQFYNITYLSLDISPGDEGDNTSFTDILPDRDSPDPLKELCRKDEKETLIKAIDMLGERDKMLLSLYYHEGLTLKEIGRVLDVGESRVCQLHSRAVGRLRKNLSKL